MASFYVISLVAKNFAYEYIYMYYKTGQTKWKMYMYIRAATKVVIWPSNLCTAASDLLKKHAALHCWGRKKSELTASLLLFWNAVDTLSVNGHSSV